MGTWRDNQKVLVEILNEKLAKEDVDRSKYMVELLS